MESLVDLKGPNGKSAFYDFQPVDPTLTAFAGQTWSSGKVVFAMTAQDVFTPLAVGAASATDLLDRAAGDGRYRLQSTALTKGDVGLGNVDNTSDAAKPISTATATALAGKADLVDGKVSISQLPAIALNDVFVVASQAAMLALTAQRGDVAVRSDVSKTFILSNETPSILSNWIELPVPAQAVLSVAGLTGAISAGSLKAALALAVADISGLQSALDGKSNVGHGHAVSDVSGLQGALDAKAPLANPNFTGRAVITYAGDGEQNSHLELYSSDGSPVQGISIRFHQTGNFYTRIRGRPGGFDFVAGASDDLVDLKAATGYFNSIQTTPGAQGWFVAHSNTNYNYSFGMNGDHFEFREAGDSTKVRLRFEYPSGHAVFSGPVRVGDAQLWHANNLTTSGPLLADYLFNNLGYSHGDNTPANRFGASFVMDGTAPGGVQSYVLTMGLGSNYPVTSYAQQWASPRRGYAGEGYLFQRGREGGGWNDWAKIKAGFADQVASGPIHSARDFPNGTLVQTNLPYPTTNGAPFVLEIKGSSYGLGVPLDTVLQGYLYANIMHSPGGIHKGLPITGIVAISVGGNLAFWWPTQGYWQGYNVTCYAAHAKDNYGNTTDQPQNRVTAISHQAKPTTASEFAFDTVVRTVPYSDPGGTFLWLGAASGLRIKSSRSDYVEVAIQTSEGANRGYFYGDSGNNVGILSNTGNWKLRLGPQGSGGSSLTGSASFCSLNMHTEDGVLRGQFYVDANNNQGFLDAVGYWRLRHQPDGLYTRISNVERKVFHSGESMRMDNIRYGLTGVYDAAQTQAIFAMGPSYELTVGGGSANYGNFYGLGWSYNPNYGGAGNNPQSKPGLAHQLLVMNAGVTQTAIGTGIWTAGRLETQSYITAAGIITAGTGQGFQNAGYQSGRNRIWSFGNADTFGLSYFQGSGGWNGADAICLHFGDASVAGSAHRFRQGGDAFHAGNVYAANFDNGARIPKTTYSQSAPSGGVDGDVHIVW